MWSSTYFITIFKISMWIWGYSAPPNQSKPLQVYIENHLRIDRRSFVDKKSILVVCFLSWARQNWRSLLVYNFDNYIWLACRRKNWYFIKKIPLKSIKDSPKKSKSPSILYRKWRNFVNKNLARVPLPFIKEFPFK